MSFKTLTQAQRDSLVTGIVNFVSLILLYFFGDQAKEVMTDVVTGLSNADLSQTPKIIDLVDAGAALDTQIAEIEGNQFYISFAQVVQKITDDIKAGNFDLLDWIHLLGALIKVGRAAKATPAAAAEVKA